MARAKIWMEVFCGRCGNMIGRYYRNAKSIRRMKEDTKDWREDDEYGNLCSDCIRELQAQRSEKKMEAKDNGD